MPENRMIFIHVHIPKCGGTAFNDILRRNFGKAFLHHYLPVTVPYSSHQAAQIIHRNTTVSAFASHGYSLDLPFHDNTMSLRAIAFIRKPVERMISYYLYLRNLPPMTEAIEYAKGHSLEQFLQYVFWETSLQEHEIALQLAHLTQQNTHNGLQMVRSLLDQQKLFLFPVEQFDEACLVLRGVFPDVFRNCAYIRRKVSRKTAFNRENIISEYAPYLEQDYALYALAQTFLRSLIRKVFQNEAQKAEALQAFRRKCLQWTPFLLLNGGIRRLMRKGIDLSYSLEQKACVP